MTGAAAPNSLTQMLVLGCRHPEAASHAETLRDKDMATIYARNLPAGVTEDDIMKALEHHAKIESIEITDDVNTETDRKTARIVLDMPLYDAEQLADRFQGRIVGGEAIRLYVPLHD
mgnify:CR=1 FL=1